MHEVIINTINIPSYKISNTSITLIILGMLIIFLAVPNIDDNLFYPTLIIGSISLIVGFGSIMYCMYRTHHQLEQMYRNNIQYINIHKKDIDNIKDFDYNVIKKAENNDDKYDRAQKIRNYVEYKLNKK